MKLKYATKEGLYMARMRLKTNATIKFTVSQCIEEFLNLKSKENLAKASIQTYKQHLSVMTEVIGDVDIKLLNNDHLRIITEHLEDEYSYNAVSTNTVYRVINTFFLWLHNEYHIELFKLKYLKTNQKIKDTFSDAELKAITKKPNYSNCSYAEARNYIAVLIGFNTACRCFSLLELKVSDIHWDKGEILFRHNKNRSSVIYKLDYHLIKELKEYIAVCDMSEDGYLFLGSNNPTQIGDRPFQSSFRRYCEARGCQVKSFHAIRRTSAVKFQQKYGNIFLTQRFLNHTSTNTTLLYLKSLGLSSFENELKDFDILKDLK